MTWDDNRAPLPLIFSTSAFLWGKSDLTNLFAQILKTPPLLYKVSEGRLQLWCSHIWSILNLFLELLAIASSYVSRL